MWNRSRTALACAAWLTASVALAQPAPRAAATAPPAASPTVVSGVDVEVRLPPDVMKRIDSAVTSFVHTQARPKVGAIYRFSQWGYQVCPTTFGLTPDMNAFVSQRIKDVAAKAGVPGDGTCSGTNVLVVITSQPAALMADVRDHHENLLGYHFIGETKALAAFQPPMKSWYVTTTSKPVYITKNSPVYRVLDYAYGPMVDCPQERCRFLPVMKSRFAFALIVVEAGRIAGKPIGAVADEIAMTALSRAGPREGCSPLPTVMDLLDPACPPSDTGLTPYDEAFLKALYAPHETEILYYERRDLERAVKAAVVADPDAPTLFGAPAAPAKPDTFLPTPLTNVAPAP